MRRKILPTLALAITAASALPSLAAPTLQRFEEYLKLDPTAYSLAAAKDFEFGTQVAVDGDTMVVSSRSAKNGVYSGVFVYERRFFTNNPEQQRFYWELVTELIPVDHGNSLETNTPTSREFGTALAISGDTIVVGDPGDTGNGVGINAEATQEVGHSENGAVHVYRKVDGEWELESYIKPHELSGPIQFGYSVAIEGNRMLIGAPVDNSSMTTSGQPSGLSNTGCGYLYERRNTIAGERWVRVFSFDFNKYPNGGGSNRRLCHSVAFDGDRVVFGAPGADYQSTEAGSVEVWEKDKVGGGWSIKALIRPPNPTGQDQFGSAVDVEGDWLVVGAPSEDSSAANEGSDPDEEDNEDEGSGAIYVYKAGAGNTWELYKMFKSNHEISSLRFGKCVTIDNERILATGPYVACRLYVLDASGEWVVDREVVRTGEDGGYDEFGASSAMSGESMVIGCPKDSSYDPDDPTDTSARYSGAVRCYQLEEMQVDVTEVGLTASGRFSLLFTGNPGYERWGMEQSTDLENWEKMTAFYMEELTPGSFIFLGATPSENKPRFFYRILPDDARR